MEDDYYAEVESYFVGRRGSPLFITPSEWQLVFQWEQQGIPLHVVKEGIDRVFDRPTALLRRRKLGYCRQTVEAAFRRFREAGVGGRDAEGGEPQSLATHLADLAAALHRLADEWRGGKDAFSEAVECIAETIDALCRQVEVEGERGSNANDVEKTLEAADGRLLDVAESATGAAIVEQLKGEAESALSSYRQRMPEKIYRAALASGYRRRLRAKLGLPMLSIYVR